jgi:hypothetical protein
LAVQERTGEYGLMMAFQPRGNINQPGKTGGSAYSHFDQEQHLYSRANFKLSGAADLDEWRQFGAASLSYSFSNDAAESMRIVYDRLEWINPSFELA